jgi:hypothetical protein
MHDNSSTDDDSADDARLCLTTGYFESKSTRHRNQKNT